MDRFWIFPLPLAIVGSLFPLLTAVESIIPAALFLGPLPSTGRMILEAIELWRVTAPYSIATGVFLGIGLALSDWFHNGHRRRNTLNVVSSLLGNLWWCGLYVTAINMFNTLLFRVALKPISVPSSWISWRVLPLLLAGIFNLIGVLWGSLRSITKSDILSPLVLTDKLKGSVRIES